MESDNPKPTRARRFGQGPWWFRNRGRGSLPGCRRTGRGAQHASRLVATFFPLLSNDPDNPVLLPGHLPVPVPAPVPTPAPTPAPAPDPGPAPAPWPHPGSGFLPVILLLTASTAEDTVTVASANGKFDCRSIKSYKTLVPQDVGSRHISSWSPPRATQTTARLSSACAGYPHHISSS